jgi:hypothetical protein
LEIAESLPEGAGKNDQITSSDGRSGETAFPCIGQEDSRSGPRGELINFRQFNGHPKKVKSPAQERTHSNPRPPKRPPVNRWMHWLASTQPDGTHILADARASTRVCSQAETEARARNGAFGRGPSSGQIVTFYSLFLAGSA